MTQYMKSSTIRDYCKAPITKNNRGRWENIPKEDLVILFEVEALTTLEISKIMGCSQDWVGKEIRANRLKQAGNAVAKRMKRKSLERYGVSHPMLLPEVQEKYRQKNFEKTGKRTFPNNIAKGKKTCLQRFGRENIFSGKEGVALVKKANIIKYGVSSFAKTKEYRDKVRNSSLEKYGTPSPNQKHWDKEQLAVLTNKTMLKDYILSRHSKSYFSIGEGLGVDATTIWNKATEFDIKNLFSPFKSKYEQEVKELLPEITLKSTRSAIPPYEIDLYSEEHKIGIEFNGNYWHSDAHKHIDKGYHYNKSKLAQDKGILIYHIFEYEWLNEIKKQAIVNQLINMFGLNKELIYARKCELKEVSFKEAQSFYAINHTIGRVNAGINLGLYYDAKLVATMTFSRNSKNPNFSWELTRYCSLAGTNVVGGASKLFKHFIRTYSPVSVVSYSDIAKTRGTLYKILGFKELYITKPQYHWTNGNETLTRYKCQLKQLNKYGSDCFNKTENEIMREKGFYKIYDCGKIVWSWRK